MPDPYSPEVLADKIMEFDLGRMALSPVDCNAPAWETMLKNLTVLHVELQAARIDGDGVVALDKTDDTEHDMFAVYARAKQPEGPALALWLADRTRYEDALDFACAAAMLSETTVHNLVHPSKKPSLKRL